MDQNKPKKEIPPHRRFSKLMDYVATRKDIPANAKLVHAVLCRLQGDNASCWPSYATMGDMCGLSRLQAVRAVKVLVEKGMVNRVPFKDENGAQTTTRFTVPQEVEANRRRLWAIKNAREKEHPGVISFPKPKPEKQDTPGSKLNHPPVQN